jgi:hypothetical protein
METTAESVRENDIMTVGVGIEKIREFYYNTFAYIFRGIYAMIYTYNTNSNIQEVDR